MTVKSIRYSESGKTVTLELTDGATISAEADVFENCSACVGEPLTDADYSLLSESAGYLKALKKALSILSYADNSCRFLKRKLVEAGHKRDVADRVVNRVIELGYIDEPRQIERLVLANARQLFGPHKITARIYAKGYGMSEIKSVMSALTASGEIDFRENLGMLIEKKLGADPTDEDKQKLMHKYGYIK